MEKVIAKTPEDTEELGYRLGSTCKGGEVFLLVGELGAGKTYFSKGLARGLGIKEVVTSPTFNIMKLYQGKKLTLCHIDAYRLSSGHDLEMIGLSDYLANEKIITVIEWADLVEDIWPKKYIKVKFRNLIQGRELKIYYK